MSYITTCSGCGCLYEEQSREAADAPDRLCGACFRKAVELDQVNDGTQYPPDDDRYYAARGYREAP